MENKLRVSHVFQFIYVYNFVFIFTIQITTKDEKEG